MEAFKVSTPLTSLLGSYPDAESLLAAAKGGEQSKIAIARLWLSEGIPYAFKDKPALYESVREWLGMRLSVDPKEISLTGSARIGQSLAPHKVGNAFGEHSDLDLFIVSHNLFERMKVDFNLWSSHFEEEKIRPINSQQQKYWPDNFFRGSKVIRRGFLDSKMVPNYDEYPNIQNIAQTMWQLKEKLKITEDAPKIKGASIRCYNDWGSFVRQMVISLS